MRTDSFRPGSSPLTRGKRRVDGQAASLRRLIPAHAGKTRSAPEREPRGRAHPRSRGENVPSRSSGRPSSGSSPLTQGKRSKARSLRVCVRLIPAHAGKTFAQRDQPSPGPAHPRSRGENPSLPPLFRLIPAHAGKTCGGRTRRRQAAAHPRSRGENMTIATDLKVSLGSSPLTRGKLRHQQIAAPGGRLIPAHAGKTPAARQSRAETAAHPRSRGENT